MLEQLISYFDHIPSSHRALILAGGITFFWLVENAIPLVSFRYNKWKHAGINFLFTITTILVNFGFAVWIVQLSDWAVANQIGFLQWFPMGNWGQLILGLLLLDLVGAYFVHWVEHKVKVMWKFHMVHHADTKVDTTTANRHHPGESVFRALFTLLGVLVCGAPMWLVMIYQSISVVLSQFNHANIRLPQWLDTTISYVIVSPNMHKVHHHVSRPQTDSNYGNIFSIWDRILGTYNSTAVHEVVYGLDVLDNQRDGELGYQLKAPFDSSIKTDY